jgi:hypothetical protein
MSIISFLLGIWGALATTLIEIAVTLVTAIPFTLCWNKIAPKFLTFIPASFYHITYWECFGLLFISVGIGHVIHRLSPLSVTIVNKDK